MRKNCSLCIINMNSIRSIYSKSRIPFLCFVFGLLLGLSGLGLENNRERDRELVISKLRSILRDDVVLISINRDSSDLPEIEVSNGSDFEAIISAIPLFEPQYPSHPIYSERVDSMKIFTRGGIFHLKFRWMKQGVKDRPSHTLQVTTSTESSLAIGINNRLFEILKGLDI